MLGAKAGRERYEQIRRLWNQAKDDPRLQSVAGMAQAQADAVVSSVKTRMGSDAPTTTPASATITTTPGTTSG